MINFDFKHECYQCRTCENVCPVRAIIIDDNLLPQIDISRCIQCNMCEKVCPKVQEKTYHTSMGGAKGYICKNLDLQKRMKSSSGGVFLELALYAHLQGWYVGGVVYDTDFMPKHVLTLEKQVILKMLGSKYVTSDMSHIITDIKKVRAEGKNVLFTGTPCQVAGVKNAFPDDSGILTVAIACHGSIERQIWRNYLDQEISENGQIHELTMRDKSNGWLNYGLRIRFENGYEKISFRNSDGYFLKCFTQGLFERDRCLNCMYKGSAISADIILADAWGIETINPKMADEYGVSSVVCITSRGTECFESVLDKFESQSVPVDTIIRNNKRIVSPAPPNPSREKFLREIYRQPDRIAKICKKYSSSSITKRIMQKAYRTFIEGRK
mgnify:CR=1 FL=1